MLKLMCRLFAGVAVATMVACGSGDRTLNEVDPDVVAQKPSFAQVYPIFQRDCIPCHTGTGGGEEDEEDEEDEAGKRNRTLGVEPGLESCAAIINNLEDIVEDVFIDNNLPPGAWPRLTTKEKLTIERWIDGGTQCD